MSTVASRKIDQGYVEEPVHDLCRNCKHVKITMGLPNFMQVANEDAAKRGNLPRFGKSNEVEKSIRCTVGDFITKKTATCNIHELALEKA